MSVFAQRSSFLFAIACLLAMSGPLLSQTKQPKPGSAVKGRVTVRGKGVPGVVVYARENGFNPQPTIYKGISDVDGNYSIVDIPPGAYQVTTMAPIYASQDPKPIVLTDGEVVEQVDFSLVRGGVITGKITTADSKPLIEERVYLMTPDVAKQQPGRPPVEQMRPLVSSATTDDRGVYRMFGLRPGRYVVTVGRNERSLMEAVSMGKRLYQTTFHPDVHDLEKATVIEVGEGTESNNIDVVVDASIQTFTATGRVTNAETNQPVPNLRFGIRSIVEGNQPGNFAGSSGVSNSRGDFRLENLMPGKFAVFIFSNESQGMIADGLTFEVVDQDVQGLVIKVHPGAVVTGTLTLEGTSDKTIFARLLELRLNSWVRSDESPNAVSQNSAIGADGSFRLAGLPSGIANFNFGYVNNRWIRSFTIRRVERDGIVQPQGLPVKAGEQITGVRIVVAYGASTVRGTIRTESGSIPPDVRFHVQVNQRPGETATMNTAMADNRGKFLIENVAVGSYELMVIANGPGLRNRPVRVIQPITVTEGVNEVTVVLDLQSQPEVPRP